MFNGWFENYVVSEAYFPCKSSLCDSGYTETSERNGQNKPVVKQVSVYFKTTVILVLSLRLRWWDGITSFIRITPRGTDVCYHYYPQQSYDP